MTAKMKWQDEGGQNPLLANKALFEATLDAFCAHSFKDASLNTIIKNAGLNKGSFYYRFVDKMDLYLSLLHVMAMEKLALINQHDLQHTAVGFFNSIRQKAEIGMRFAHKEPRYTALWRRVLVEERTVREAINTCFQGLSSSAWSEMVEKAKVSGELRSDLPTATMAMYLSVVMNHLDLFIPADIEESKVLKDIDYVLQALENGLKAGGA